MTLLFALITISVWSALSIDFAVFGLEQLPWLQQQLCNCKISTDMFLQKKKKKEKNASLSKSTQNRPVGILSSIFFHFSNVQTILNDPSLMQQIHQMSQKLQTPEPAKPEIDMQEQMRHQQLLQQQAEFDQQISQVLDQGQGVQN